MAISISSDSSLALARVQQAVLVVRDDVRDNPYLQESLRALNGGALRSAIGSYWNAVVDDLRQKVMHRSLDLFNKQVKPRREVQRYEDFQDLITDHDLIEGAYAIGAISWEARKLLQQARETRNLFDGHPRSSEPSPVKVLAFIEDCNRYVLCEEFPAAIIDINSYLAQMDTANFDRNNLAIEQTFGDLPEEYKSELVNRFYTIYVDPGSSTTIRANIEAVLPIVWPLLAKETRRQVARRLDRDVHTGDRAKIEAGTTFVARVSGLRYVTTATRKIIFAPVVEDLEQSLDNWDAEEKAVTKLENLGMSIPDDLLDRYVTALALTYVGYRGTSAVYSRTDFCSDGAAPRIVRLFKMFDDRAARAFISALHTNKKLGERGRERGKAGRIRSLANILLERPGIAEDAQETLEMVADEGRTADLMRLLAR